MIKICPGILIAAFSFLGCNNDVSRENENLLVQKLDSLSDQISVLQKQIDEKEKQDAEDSVQTNPAAKQIVQLPQKTIVKTQPTFNPGIPPQKKTKPQLTTPPPMKRTKPSSLYTAAEGDTAFYYYTGLPKRVSVKVTPWMNGRRKVIFYNPFGNVTYTCDDVRLSYTITTLLKKFHPNGAAALIEIHNNPGASNYWSDTDITFSINNEPQWRTVHKKPVESMEDARENKFYWNETSGQWVKQEIVKEQPVPHK